MSTTQWGDGHDTTQQAVLAGVLRHLQRIFEDAQGQGKPRQAAEISPTQRCALQVIAGHDGIKVKDLARALAIKSATASNMLDKLERSGWIRRQRTLADQRMVQIRLTAQGAALLQRLPRPGGQLPAALQRLTTEQLHGLHEHLALLVIELDSTAN